MVAVVVFRRSREHDVRPDAPNDLRDLAAGSIVVEHGKVAELGANVIGARELRAGGRFAAADAGDLFGTVFHGAAVAGRHGADRHVMPALDEVQDRAGGEDLHVIGVRVNGEDIHECSFVV
jgi:hypothetical protein